MLSFDRGPITYECVEEHIDPLGRGFYIGYSQRVTEKKLLQQDYHQQKLLLTSEMHRNAENRVAIGNDIETLRRSNENLSQLTREQDLELMRLSRR